MKKLTVVVLFGGQSSEHEVSCMSAANMIAALDEEKYDVLPEIGRASCRERVSSPV